MPTETSVGPSTLKLSQAIELGTFLEHPGSFLSFKGCAIGLGMAAVGVPKEERTGKKARQLWPWLGRVARTEFFGLKKVDYTGEISDWYFNVKLGRMNMAALLDRIRAIEPTEDARAREALAVGFSSSSSSDSR